MFICIYYICNYINLLPLLFLSADYYLFLIAYIFIYSHIVNYIILAHFVRLLSLSNQLVTLAFIFSISPICHYV